MLEPEDVHIWQIALSQSRQTVEAMREILSLDERQRADRFVFDEHRERFIVGRAALRTILASYMAFAPSALSFTYSRYGKPSLATRGGGPRICFNMSHSADLGLCAVTRGREIGIDVEAIRQVVDADQMAARYFESSENASYRALPPNQRMEGFFERWTLKEAYIKAHGQGLSMPLDQFSIAPLAGESERFCVRSSNPEDDARWSVARLSTMPGYMAALVLEGQNWRPVHFTFQVSDFGLG